MVELVGWIATICFAFSALPQAIDAIKKGNAQGLNNLTLALWMIGEILILIYALNKYPTDYILLVNYIGNIILLSIITKYKLFPRLKNNGELPNH